MFVFKWIINKKLFTHLSFSEIEWNFMQLIQNSWILRHPSWSFTLIWLIFVRSGSSDNTLEDTSCNRSIIRAGGASGCSAACLLIAYQLWLSLLPLLLCSVDGNDRQDPHLVKAWGYDHHLRLLLVQLPTFWIFPIRVFTVQVGLYPEMCKKTDHPDWIISGCSSMNVNLNIKRKIQPQIS